MNMLQQLASKLNKKISKKAQENEAAETDAAAHFIEEMPLSLKIEKYQRRKLL